MKIGNRSRHRFIAAIPIIFACVLLPAAHVSAQQEGGLDNKELMNKANHLKRLLNDLLSSPNSSSIQENIKSGDENVKFLMDRAQEEKIWGEGLLNEKRYLEAATHFQSSLEYVVQAIREQKTEAEETRAIKSRLQQSLNTNDTFIAAATRVVMQESNGDAIKLLNQAREARGRAETVSKQGKDEEALAELENSTRLAKQAIMLVRQGKVIERKAK